MSQLISQTATTFEPDSKKAVDDLVHQFGSMTPDCVLVFCCAEYDLDALGASLDKAFACPVIGCTTAGQIGPSGYQLGGISALALAGGDLKATQFFMSPLSECQMHAAKISDAINNARIGAPPDRNAFAMVLVDGLSHVEERLMASMFQCIGDIPLVGGSAGDSLLFQKTSVYHKGRFRSDAATITLFETTAPVLPVRFKHFRPTSRKMVITEANPETRTVFEINGEPAAKVFAETIEVARDKLTAIVVMHNPFVLEIAGHSFIRSVARVNDDDSITFFCSIDRGLVLSIGEPLDAVATLVDALDALHCQQASPEVILGFDCILRRLEFEARGLTEQIGQLLRERRVFGFNTYGEQWQGFHMNQTFTGIALGSRP
jgi:hypothetical protein